MSHVCVLKSSGFAQKILEGLQELFAAELCMDLELVDGNGDVVKTHMLVLASVSPIIRAFAQPASQGLVRLQFGYVTAAQWQQVLAFLYSGELIVELHQVEELYNVASALQIQELEGLLLQAKEHTTQADIVVQPPAEVSTPDAQQSTTTTTITSTSVLPKPQIRKNTRPRLPVFPGERFQGPFGEVEVGNAQLSESEKLLKINQAFGHVTRREDAIMSLKLEEQEAEGEEEEEEEGNRGYDREEEEEQEQEEAIEEIRVSEDQSKPFKLKCDKCDALLPLGPTVLQDHMDAHDRIGEDFSCDKCSKSFLNRPDLKKHVETHVKLKTKHRKIEQCRFCTKIYNFQHLVDKHIVKEHLEDSGFDMEALTCDECEAKFPTVVLLNYHKKRSHVRGKPMRSQHEPKPCPLCQTITQTLSAHMKSQHPKSPAYQCMYCPEIFVKLRTRQTHVEKFHRQVLCKYCRKKFPNHEKLLKHLPLCEKAPESHREAWSRKIKDSHARIYNCTHCKLKFKALNHLRKHEKEAHGTFQELQCHICLKKIPSNSAFKDHVMRHLGVRPFSCPHCPKCFTSSSDRTRHIKNMHTMAPLYTCHICQKSFRDCSNFYAHGTKAHGESFRGLVQKAQKLDHVAGVPPQLSSVAEMRVTDLIQKIRKECSGSHRDPGVCPICNKLFTKRSNLFTHGRKLHKINFTHLLKGKYSKYTYLREIIKANKGESADGDEQMEKETEELNEEMNEESEEMIMENEFVGEEEEDSQGVDQNVLPESYESIEMIEVKTEHMEEFDKDEALVVQDQDGTVMHLYEMPRC